jgi:flavodoxin
MSVLILYDSVFGNTEQIARAVCSGADLQGNAQAVKVSEVKPEQLQGLKLLIVGSPTRAFRPTEATQKFLKGLAKDSLKGVRVAAFDTRMDVNESKSAVLRFFVKIFGYAAKPTAYGLTAKGGELAAPPEGFLVNDTQGPLKEGELERAANWAKSLQ